VKDFENDTGWVFNKYLNKTPHMVIKVNKGKKKKLILEVDREQNIRP